MASDNRLDRVLELQALALLAPLSPGLNADLGKLERDGHSEIGLVRFADSLWWVQWLVSAELRDTARRTSEDLLHDARQAHRDNPALRREFLLVMLWLDGVVEALNILRLAAITCLARVFVCVGEAVGRKRPRAPDRP